MTGLFPITRLHAHFGPLLTVATLVATALAAACHVGARWSGRAERRTGNLVQDFFMGAVLNPRLGPFDIKFFVELRPGIMLWFLFTVSMLVRQYETRGRVTTSMALLAFYYLCYVNACYKGEECVPMSMDIARENFGWMLAWGNLVWVPFVYCLPAFYVLQAGVDMPLGWAAALLALHLLAYWVFDTANSQKDYFRNSGRRLRRAPPAPALGAAARAADAADRARHPPPGQRLVGPRPPRQLHRRHRDGVDLGPHVRVRLARALRLSRSR